MQDLSVIVGKDNKLAADLEYILARTDGLWDELRGGRLFLTGGTGFFGCWLLESFLWANEALSLDAEVVVLTRDAAGFTAKAPRLAAHDAVRLHVGDIRSFNFPAGEFSHVIHAATDASAQLNEENPLLMVDTITAGTRHALEFARVSGARKVLFTSSGAVYGRQPSDVTHVAEDYTGAPDTMNAGAAYGEGKRLAELMCAVYKAKHGMDVKVARCFAFVGPYLPLDTHFAVGNFMRHGLAGETIRIGGDGTPRRSYLYAADLAIWLWHILVRGAACHPYNVGSDQDLSIAELAATVADVFEPKPAVHVAREAVAGAPVERYVPCVQRALDELSLRPEIDLPQAIRRTVAWHGAVGRNV